MRSQGFLKMAAAGLLGAADSINSAPAATLRSRTNFNLRNKIFIMANPPECRQWNMTTTRSRDGRCRFFPFLIVPAARLNDGEVNAA